MRGQFLAEPFALSLLELLRPCAILCALRAASLSASEMRTHQWGESERRSSDIHELTFHVWLIRH